MRPPTPLIKSSIYRHHFQWSAKSCSPGALLVFTLPDLATSRSPQELKFHILPRPLRDAIALAALDSVQTRTCAVGPKSVIINCIPRASSFPCVLHQCFTAVPLIIVVPLLVDFHSAPVAQSESTCMSTSPRRVLASPTSFPTPLCRIRHLRACVLRERCCTSAPSKPHAVQRRRQAPELLLLRFVQREFLWFDFDSSLNPNPFQQCLAMCVTHFVLQPFLCPPQASPPNISISRT